VLEWYHLNVMPRQDEYQARVRHPPKRKLKLAIVAPIAQLALAIALLILAHRTSAPDPSESSYYVPTAALVCYGINAPAALIKGVGVSITAEFIDRPLLAYGFGIEDGWFLGGVIIVWYLVGSALDRLRSAGGWQTLGKLSVRGIAVNLLLLLLGGYLFYFAVDALRVFGKWNNPVRNIAEGLLFLVWSVALILTSGQKLVSGIRNKHSVPDVPV